MNVDQGLESVSGKPTIIRGFTKCVLVADDNPTIRAALRSYIENFTTMRFCEACDGEQAVEQAKAQQPDVAIIDMVMPNLNGLAAASVMRSLRPNLHIVVFTLHSDVIGETFAKSIGVDLVVSKSEGASGLLRALETIWTENALS